MKIYFAHDPGNTNETYVGKDLSGIKRWLVSYTELPSEPKDTMRRYERLVETLGIELYLDCGAFSAFQLGTKIKLEDYLWFIRRYGHIFREIAALDVIGNGPDSFENYVQMYNSGVKKCIPCWHHKDDKILIKKYLDYTDYIAIGNLVGSALNRRLRARTIRTGIDIIRQFNPDAKIHLYGVTTLLLLRMFGHEIESVDSSSWLSGSKYAMVYNLNGTFDYHGRIRKAFASNAYRINAYNARKFIELEQLINERKQHDRDRKTIPVTLRHS